MIKAFFSALIIITFSQNLMAMGAAPPIPLDPLNDEVKAIALQSDGKVILGGNFLPNRILRMDQNGNIDPTFGSSWVAGGFNQTVRVIHVLKDDSMIVGGDFTNFDTAIVGYLVKLDANGNFVAGFTQHLGVGFDDSVRSIVVQANGRMLVGGSFKSLNGNPAIHLIRLSADGHRDNSFDVNFGFNLPVHSISLQADGLACYAGGEFQSYNGAEFLRAIKLNLKGQPAESYFGQ